MFMVVVLTKLTFVAALVCLGVQLFEKKIVGVKSEFWDIFAGCFLAVLGVTAYGWLLSIVIGLGVFFQIVYWLGALVLFVVIFHKLFKNRPSQSFKLGCVGTVTMALVLTLIQVSGILI